MATLGRPGLPDNFPRESSRANTQDTFPFLHNLRRLENNDNKTMRGSRSHNKHLAQERGELLAAVLGAAGAGMAVEDQGQVSGDEEGAASSSLPPSPVRGSTTLISVDNREVLTGVRMFSVTESVSWHGAKGSVPYPPLPRKGNS